MTLEDEAYLGDGFSYPRQSLLISSSKKFKMRGRKTICTDMIVPLLFSAVICQRDSFAIIYRHVNQFCYLLRVRGKE